MTTIDSVAPARDLTTRSPIPGGLLAAVAGPAALIASNVCFAILTMDGHAEDGEDYLRLVGERPVLVETGAALGLLACLFIVPAVWAVAARLRPQRPRLANTGAWLMASGYVMGVAMSVEALVVVSISRASGDPGIFIDASDRHLTFTSMAMYGIFGLGALLGGVVLGVAMLRCPRPTYQHRGGTPGSASALGEYGVPHRHATPARQGHGLERPDRHRDC